MVTGRTPFVGDSFMGILTQHMFEPPPPLHEVNPTVRVSEGLEAVIMKALAKDPAERFQSMEEMVRTLRGVGEWGGEVTDVSLALPRAETTAAALASPTASSTGPVAVASPGARRKGWLAAAVVALVVAGGGALWWSSSGAGIEQPASSGTAAATERGDRVAGRSAAAVGDQATGRDAPARPTGTAAVPGTETQGGTQADAGSERAQDGGAAAAAAAEGGDKTGQDEPPQLVQLTVETKPTGARVTLDTGETVCSVTPCVFDTPAGRPLVLLATKGRAKGRMEVRPLRSTRIEISLRRPGRRGASRSGGRPGRGKGSRVSPDDLKKVDLFQLNP